MDQHLKQIELYEAEKITIKNNAKYKELMAKNRGDLDNKLLDRFRIRLTSLDAKIALLQKEIDEQKPKPEPKPVFQNLRHPTNPALQRLATARNPDGPRNKFSRINRSTLGVPASPMSSGQTEEDKTHKALINEEKEVDEWFAKTRQREAPLNLKVQPTKNSKATKEPEMDSKKKQEFLTPDQKRRAKFSRTVVLPEEPAPIAEKVYGRQSVMREKAQIPVTPYIPPPDPKRGTIGRLSNVNLSKSVGEPVSRVPNLIPHIRKDDKAPVARVPIHPLLPKPQEELEQEYIPPIDDSGVNDDDFDNVDVDIDDLEDLV
jgi:hypothetical protein